MHESTRRVFLISASDLGWEILRTTLASLPHVCVVGEATRAHDALESIPNLDLDVIITAAVVEGRSAAPLLTELRAQCPAVTMVVVAPHIPTEQLLALREIGVSGYLVWGDMDHTTFRHCLAAALGGTVLVASRMAAQGLLNGHNNRTQANASALLLSARERSVLAHLTAGLTREQIAATEQLSVRTVERIIARLEEKLDARTPFMLGRKPALLLDLSA